MKRIYRHIIRLLSAALAMLSTVCPPQSAIAAVTLAAFTVTGENEVVYVEWETATELNNAGFYVWRSLTESGTYTRISPLIPADQTDPLSGAYYEYIDYDVTNGTIYWYKLEAIDSNDQSSEFYGPLFAIPGEATPTRTATQLGAPTQTRTATINPTGTSTQPQPTAASATPYPAPNATATFPASTPLPTQPFPTLPPQPTSPGVLQPTPTQLSTPVTPTTSTVESVVPLLEITLIFPTEGINLRTRTTPTPTLQPVAAAAPPLGWSPWGGAMLIGFLLIIWLMLGSWFYLSFRRLE